MQHVRSSVGTTSLCLGGGVAAAKALGTNDFCLTSDHASSYRRFFSILPPLPLSLYVRLVGSVWIVLAALAIDTRGDEGEKKMHFENDLTIPTFSSWI